MRYGFTIPAADIPVANTPEIGGESKRVKLSYDEGSLVGSLSFPAPASGTFEAAVPAFGFDALGNDLVVRCGNGVKSDTDIVIAFSVTFADNSTGTAQAAFTVPDFAKNQSANLPMGLAVDLKGTAGNVDKKIKAITGIQSISGGSRGAQLEILALPDAWQDLPGCTSKQETLNVPKGLDIAHGLNASEWTKFGMSEVGKVEMEAFHITAGDGLQRFNALPFSVLVETYAEDRVLKERNVYLGCRGAFNADRKDGDDRVMDRGTATFRKFAKFV